MLCEAGQHNHNFMTQLFIYSLSQNSILSPHFPNANHTSKKKKTSAVAITAQIQLSFETRFHSLQIGLVIELSFVKGNEVVYKGKDGFYFSFQRVSLCVLVLYFDEIGGKELYLLCSFLHSQTLGFFPFSGYRAMVLFNLSFVCGVYNLAVGTWSFLELQRIFKSQFSAFSTSHLAPGYSHVSL